MSYKKTEWVDRVTPVNAENMNHIEDGIYGNSDLISLLSEEIDTLNSENDINKDNIENLKNNKQDVLISGRNIKTINGNSLLGEGNLTIQSGVVTAESLSPLLEGVGYVSVNLNSSSHQIDISIDQEMIDNNPKQNSNNLVKSGGVFNSLAGKLDASKQSVATVGGLVTPTAVLANNELVGVDVNGEQIRVRLGEGLTLERSGSSIGEGGGDGGGGGDAGGGIGGKQSTSIYTLKSSGGGGGSGGKQLYEHEITLAITTGEDKYICFSQPLITDSNKEIEISDFDNYSDRLTFTLYTPLLLNSKTKAFMASNSVGTNLIEFSGVKTDSTGLNVVCDDIVITPSQDRVECFDNVIAL